MIRVHQILSGAGPRDAITTEAAHFRARFTEWGWGGGDWAARILPGTPMPVRGLAHLQTEPEDLLLIHHSAATARLEELLALPNPKLVHYHNITPAHWLWDYAPTVAAQCAVGRQQLALLVRAADACSADSEFNRGELRAIGADEVTVIPLPIDPARLGPRGDEPGHPPHVIFVGRLSPHKRQEEIIRVFAAYRRERAPDARLMLIGEPVSEEYLVHLRALAQWLAPDSVNIESGLDQATLGERYRRANAMLCLSAHEGFCVPVLEAFHFGVPVVARPAGAIAETAGEGALLADEDDPAVLSELLHLAINDDELRAELRGRAAVRLTALALEQVGERLRHAVEGALSAATARS